MTMPDSPTPPPNPYIRTYAKDLAQASGKPAPVTPQGAPFTLPVSYTDTEKSAKDRDDVLERLKERARKDPISESQLLPETLHTPVAIAPTTNEKPEDMAIAEAVVTDTTPLQEFTPQKPVQPVYQEPIPQVTELPNLAPRAPQPVPNVVVEVAPTQPPVDTGPSPLHTFSSDFSDRIDTKGASTFSVLAAQSDAKTQSTVQQLENKSHKSALIIAFGVLLLVVGGVGAYGAYRYVANRSFVPIVATVPSLVFADEREAVAGEGSVLRQALVTSSQKSLDQGKVRVLYLTQASTTSTNETVTVALPGGRLVGALQLNAPDILLRNIGNESTVGIVHAAEQTRVFFILRVLSYERTFAGMLTWERTIQESLQDFYPEYEAPAPAPPTIATTTKIVNGKRVVVTTTTPAVVPERQPPHFVDEVTSNHNVRALKDSFGKTIMLYGYRDKETLIIARDEAAFAELSNRLQATKQQ